MKGREKCSRSGTVKVTRVTSNLRGYNGVTTRVCLHVVTCHLLVATMAVVSTPASQEPVRLQASR